jgi:hypothetical protein
MVRLCSTVASHMASGSNSHRASARAMSVYTTVTLSPSGGVTPTTGRFHISCSSIEP